MLAKDVMTVNVVTVEPGTTVGDIATLLLDRNISAAPVVDTAGKIVGIVSEGDLMRRTEADTDKRTRSWWLRLMTVSAESAADYIKSHGQRASDVMTRTVMTVEEDTPVSEIAQLMEEKHIKRVPVMGNGKLVGIVSRANLLRALATRKAEPLAAVSENDQAIQERLREVLRAEPWANLSFFNTTVNDGVVHLWGIIQSPEQAKALHIAAESVPGVKSVEDHLQPFTPQLHWSE